MLFLPNFRLHMSISIHDLASFRCIAFIPSIGSPRDTPATGDFQLLNMRHISNLGANAFFLVAFTLLLPFQVFFGIRYRTWGFLVGMVCGLILEILGYTARVALSKDADLFLM